MLKSIKEQILTPYCRCNATTDLVVKLLVVIICIVTVMIYNQSYSQGEDIKYPLEGSFEEYDPYTQQFDAFMKGRLSFDYIPDENFMSLENPYDPDAREEDTFLYDRAYYNGRYYSYFGTAPIFTVIYPYYFIMGRLPSGGVIQTVYMTLFAVFFPLLIMNLAKKLSSRLTSPMAMIITYTAYLSSLNLLMGRGDKPFYYIAATSAMAFLAMFMFFFYKGICAERFRNRCIYLLAAGISYVLCFHSRINVAFAAVFFIIPMIIFGIIFKKREINKIRILAELCFLGIPVVIGLTVSLIYNYVRFDNPMEFGATYQLTVADVSTYALDIKEIGYAIYCYYIAPIEQSMINDSLMLIHTVPFTLDRYLYVDSYFGIMRIPFMLFSLAVPFVCARKSTMPAVRVTLISASVGTVVVSWIDFCMGGLIFRYLCDISVILAVIASVCAFKCVDGIRGIGEIRVRKILLIVIAVVFIVFIYMVLRVMAADDYNLFKLHENSLFYKLFN